jgi:hypothetical protein
MTLSQLNWRQGFFRFWVIGSVLFVIAVAAISYSDVKTHFESAASMKGWENVEGFVPVICGNARGVFGTDYTAKFDDLLPSGLRPGATCWYAMSKFRPLHPEYSDLSDEELTSKLFKEVGIPLNSPHPWTTLLNWIGIAFGIPLIVLILGTALAWALSGFRARQTKQP